MGPDNWGIFLTLFVTTGEGIGPAGEISPVVCMLKNGLGVSMVAPEGELVFWFSRTQVSASLDAFSKTFVFCATNFFCSTKGGGAMAHPASLVAWTLVSERMSE